MAAKLSSKTEKEQSNGCGWFGCRPKILEPLGSPFLLLVLLCGYFIINSIVINGIYSSSLSTIETRFSLTSSQMGLVTSIYDIAALIFIGPVSYYGVKNKPVVLGIGMITMGVGYIIFLLPHLLAKEYVPAITSSSVLANFSSPLVCASQSSRAPAGSCNAKEETTMPYQLFLAGMFIAGAGCAPMISLGIPYMDESTSRENSPLYVGAFQTSGILAAVGGFVVASGFLKIFVHPSVSVSITPQSPSWIGAWWLGFAIFAAFALVVGICLSALPKTLRRKTPSNEGSEEKQETETEKSEQVGPTLRELPRILKLLILENPTFVLTSIAVSLQSLLVSGSTAFNPKIGLFQFRLTASEASVLYGLTAGTGAIFGNMTGSLIMKKLKLSTLGIMKMVVAASILNVLISTYTFIHCDTYPAAGVNTKFYDAQSFTGISLNNQCNRNCSCAKDLFLPVCVDGLTYVNPCFAGCRQQKGPFSFTNCSCTAKIENPAPVGLCKSSCGVWKTIYFILSWVSGFSIMLMAAPATVLTLRCVPFNYRSFAMGLQWMLVRVLGSIPGPVLFGYIIDQSCVFWVKSCKNSKGSCRIYKNKQLARSTGSLCVTISGLISIFIVLAYISLKRQVRSKNESVFNIEKENKDIQTKL